MNYLEIIRNVVNNGTLKQATRLDDKGNPIPVENGTIGTFCEIFRHDMATGFPLTTLRKMPWRSIRVELEGFIKGITSKAWYQERKCNFWNEWANPVAVEDELVKFDHHVDMIYEGQLGCSGEDLYVPQRPTKKEVQAELDDLGPIYGYQWRSFNKTYKTQSEDDGDFNNYTDQFKSIVDKLKATPYDRRMVCSAWNPNQMYMAALPACHIVWGVCVYGNKLNLWWTQRSCDLLLGVCSNIASYALLLELLAKEANLVPGELVGTLADCHIYENHMDAARELIQREEKELPRLKIVTPQGLDLQANQTERKFSIFDWEWSDAVLTEYNPHDKIDVGSVTV